MKYNTIQNAWKQFEQTGTIADYLAYKSLELEGGTPLDGQNPGNCPRTDSYAGSGQKTSHPHRGYGPH
jgi:hypothetical protein